MRHAPILLCAAAALGLAGCGGESDGTADQAATNTPSTPVGMPAEPATEPVGNATIAVASKEPFGEYLVDGSGRSLYVLEGNRLTGGGEGAGTTCTDACLEAWPPLMTSGAPSASEGVDGSKLGTMPRPDGQQVTYAGWPLYYYVGDQGEGSTSGQDLHDRWGEWYLLSPAGEIVHAGESGGSAESGNSAESSE